MQATALRLFAIAAALAASACAETLPNDPKLALACQTRDCVCTEQSQPVFGPAATVPILWQPNGDAYCPADYVLKIVTEDR